MSIVPIFIQFRDKSAVLYQFIENFIFSMSKNKLIEILHLLLMQLFLFHVKNNIHFQNKDISALGIKMVQLRKIENQIG